mgnify:CR=1 FL=1
MAETLGIGLRAGFKREAVVTTPTWPAASAASLTALLPVLTLSLNDGIDTAEHSGTSNSFGPLGVEIVSRQPTLTVTLPARYEGFEELWACALGYMAKRIGAVVMPELLATGVYRHLYECDAALDTTAIWATGDDGFVFAVSELLYGQRKVRRGTFALDMQVSVWEYLSSMVQALTLQASPDGVSLTVELVADSLSRVSSINTSATMLKLLPPTSPRLLFTDLVCRIGAQSASTPLGSGDVVTCTTWTLRLENDLVAAPGPRTGLSPGEYARGSLPQVIVSLELSRHTADLWQTRWDAATALMADFVFTSTREVAAGQPYRLRCYLPRCHVVDASLDLRGAHLPADTITLTGVAPSIASAGFPTMRHLTPLAIEVVSGISQHPLL